MKFFTLDDFRYNEATDEYVCPEGKRLWRNAKRVTSGGIIYRRYRSEEDDCKGCIVRGRCIKNRGGKKKYLMVPIRVVPGNLKVIRNKSGSTPPGLVDYTLSWSRQKLMKLFGQSAGERIDQLC